LKIGIFSDIHSNLEALETALAFLQAEGVNEYLCLGDIVGYGASPEECINRIRELPGVAVAGNHDYGAVDKTPIESFNDAAQQAIRWTRHAISANSKRYLESLPLAEVRHGLRLVHSAPSSPGDWDYIMTQSDITYELETFSESVCLVGHSHTPFVASKHNARAQPQTIHELEFTLPNHASKFLINAGSIGQPRDGDPRLCLLVYDSHSQRMRIHRLDYDIETAQRKIRAAGLPEILATRLSLGR
jgi:diadenosine tetraphosphatase ApaH/serine/threonine PP2A family protein phosphatase